MRWYSWEVEEIARAVAESAENAERTAEVASGAHGNVPFVLGAAVYRSDAPPSTVAQRRVALRGWVISSLDARVLFASARGTHRDLSVSLYAQDPGGWQQLVGRSGTGPAGSWKRSTVVQAGARWVIEVTGTDAHRGVASFQAAVVFAVGALLSLLAFLLVRDVTRSDSGMLVREAFMEVAEDTGQVAALDRWIVEQACNQAAAWERAGLSLSLAVNVSTRQLERPSLVDELANALAVSGLDPSKLALEIHETALRRAPAAAGVMFESITALGVHIILDHFGTGYTSAAQLSRFPIDGLKIDGSFVAAITDSSGPDALVHTLVQLGKQLDMVIVAEGIETPSQLEQMCREGCDVGQGALIVDPLEADAIESFIAGWPESSPEFQHHHDHAMASTVATGEAQLEVVVVEDHLAVRKGIELLLRSEGFRVAGVAGEIGEARELLARRRHDVALITVHLGTESAVPLVEELLQADPRASIVLYTGASSGARIEAAVRVGTPGFVLKSSPVRRLAEALRCVPAGGTYVDPDLAPLLSRDTEPSTLPSLSPREREVFELLAEGLTGQAIAERLFLSPETVKTHIRNATTKLGAKTRVQAIALMVRETRPS